MPCPVYRTLLEGNFGSVIRFCRGSWLLITCPLFEVSRALILVPTQVIMPMAETTIRPRMREYSRTSPPESSRRAWARSRVMARRRRGGERRRSLKYFRIADVATLLPAY